MAKPATTITPDRFGKDHYSTLAYLEVRAVDHKGKIHHEHMRCDYWRHPVLWAAKKSTVARMKMAGMLTETDTGRLVFAQAQKRYPTRLADGAEQHGHDDYDCVLDFIAAGWVTVDSTEALTESALDPNAVYRFTETGTAVAHALRAHKGNGGMFATFRAPNLIGATS